MKKLFLLLFFTSFIYSMDREIEDFSFNAEDIALFQEELEISLQDRLSISESFMYGTFKIDLIGSWVTYPDYRDCDSKKSMSWTNARECMIYFFNKIDQDSFFKTWSFADQHLKEKCILQQKRLQTFVRCKDLSFAFSKAHDASIKIKLYKKWQSRADYFRLYTENELAPLGEIATKSTFLAVSLIDHLKQIFKN